MDILRTPEERFAGIPDYPFAPNWFEVDLGDGLTARKHYVDEGPKDGPPVLLFHGEPSWSFLYRKMIPILADAGFRVLAPDLIGFGKSDKPDDIAFFTYAKHVDWLTQWRAAVEPRPAALFCAGLGRIAGPAHGRAAAGPVLLRRSQQHLPARRRHAPARFPRMARIRAHLAGFRDRAVARPRDADTAERGGDRRIQRALPGRAVQGRSTCLPVARPGRRRHARGGGQQGRLAETCGLRQAILTLFGEEDPITKGAEKHLIERIAGAKGQPHRTLSPAATSVRKTSRRNWHRASSTWLARRGCSPDFKGSWCARQDSNLWPPD